MLGFLRSLLNSAVRIPNPVTELRKRLSFSRYCLKFRLYLEKNRAEQCGAWGEVSDVI